MVPPGSACELTSMPGAGADNACLDMAATEMTPTICRHRPAAAGR